MISNYIAAKYVPTKTKKMMYFGSWLDHTGASFDSVHFPQYVPVVPFRGLGCYFLGVKVDPEYGVYSLEVYVIRLWRLSGIRFYRWINSSSTGFTNLRLNLLPSFSNVCHKAFQKRNISKNFSCIRQCIIEHSGAIVTDKVRRAFRHIVIDSYDSLIENGQTKLTDELLEKIKAIEVFEDFDQETPLPVENLAVDERIPLRWPWGRTSLNITIVVVVILLLNLASFFADHAWRGFGVGAEPDGFTLIITVILLALFVGIMYLLFRLAKWLMNRRSK